MTRLNQFNLFFFFCLLLMGTACKKNSVNKLTNPYSDGVVPNSGAPFYIFKEEVMGGGGVAFLPGGENQTIDFFDHSSPRRSVNQIRYSWNGEDVFDSAESEFQHGFAGFYLSAGDDPLAYNKTLDLSAAGYTQLKFFARGELSSDTKVKIEAPGDGHTTSVKMILDSTQLSSSWQEFTLPIGSITPNPFSNVRVFLVVTFEYTQPGRTTVAGDGGVIYMDDIRYE